jgi:hypothetical protein
MIGYSTDRVIGGGAGIHTKGPELLGRKKSPRGGTVELNRRDVGDRYEDLPERGRGGWGCWGFARNGPDRFCGEKSIKDFLGKKGKKERKDQKEARRDRRVDQSGRSGARGAGRGRGRGFLLGWFGWAALIGYTFEHFLLYALPSMPSGF